MKLPKHIVDYIVGEDKVDCDFNGSSYVENLTDWEQGYNKAKAEARKRAENVEVGVDEDKVQKFYMDWVDNTSMRSFGKNIAKSEPITWEIKSGR